MKGVKELKRRLKGVKSIRKITKAMEMVAATKLRRLQERALATRPFAKAIEGMVSRVAAHADTGSNPLLAQPAAVVREAVIIVGADKGLCGSYNSNLHRAAVQHLNRLAAEGVKADVWVLGKRPQAFFGKVRDINLCHVHPDPVEKVGYRDAALLARKVVDTFLAGQVQRVSLITTRMLSLTAYKPGVQALLPFARPAAGNEAVEYILEPDADQILTRLLPRNIEMQLYAGVLEALACEFASRRMAMKNATDNADEMTHLLSMEYNKARQSGITGELLEIVGGAEALNA